MDNHPSDDFWADLEAVFADHGTDASDTAAFIPATKEPAGTDANVISGHSEEFWVDPNGVLHGHNPQVFTTPALVPLEQPNLGDTVENTDIETDSYPIQDHNFNDLGLVPGVHRSKDAVPNAEIIRYETMVVPRVLDRTNFLKFAQDNLFPTAEDRGGSSRLKEYY